MKDLRLLYEDLEERKERLKDLEEENQNLTDDIDAAANSLSIIAYEFYDACISDFGFDYTVDDMAVDYVSNIVGDMDVEEMLNNIDENGCCDDLDDVMKHTAGIGLWDSIKQTQWDDRYNNLDIVMQDIIDYIKTDSEEEKEKIKSNMTKDTYDFVECTGDYCLNEYKSMSDEEIEEQMGDVVCEYCDNFVDNYFDDLFDWFSEHYDTVECYIQDNYKSSYCLYESIYQIIYDYYYNAIMFYESDLDTINNDTEQYNSNGIEIEFLENDIDEIEEEIKIAENILEDMPIVHVIDEYTNECMEYYL